MSENSKLKIQFGPINDKNVESLKSLNLSILPVQYNAMFYQKVLNYPKYSRLGFNTKNIKKTTIFYRKKKN